MNAELLRCLASLADSIPGIVDVEKFLTLYSDNEKTRNELKTLKNLGLIDTDYRDDTIYMLNVRSRAKDYIK